MKILLVVALLWLAALPSEATVLIYKGTSRNFTATTPGDSAGEQCILIVDLALNKMSLLIWHTENNHRYQVLEISQQTLDTTLVPGLNKSTYEIYAHVSNIEAQGGFGDQAAFFRGPQSSLIVSGGTGNYNYESHPRALGGEYRYCGAGLGSSYEEHTISLAYDQTVTVGENDEGHSIAAVESDMIAYVTSLGYPL
jgi:hypothetical protein